MDTLIIYMVFFAAWLTHVVHCFNDEAWGLLIAGAVMFPVAVVNGFYIWLT